VSELAAFDRTQEEEKAGKTAPPKKNKGIYT
jgi:hypothetical protein